MNPTIVHARGASKLSATAAAISVATMTPTIAQNSVVSPRGFGTSTCEPRARHLHTLADRSLGRILRCHMRPLSSSYEGLTFPAAR